MKKGDTIICINNSFKSTEITLSKDKTYIANDIYIDPENNREYVSIEIDSNTHYDLFIDRFLTIKEWRKLKLKTLNESSL